MYPYCFAVWLSVWQTCLPELTASTLPSQWFEVLAQAMFEGNALHDLLFDGEARNLDIEDAVESCGDDIHISSYDQAIGFDLLSGDFHL